MPVTFILRFIGFILSISWAAAQYQTENSFRSRFGPGALVGYLAYVPDDYESNPARKYPLMIFLHGSGEKAWKATDLNDLSRVKKNGPPKLIEQGKDFPFIVISPQCPFATWDDVTTDNYNTEVRRPGEFVDEILEKMKTLYRVDPDRIYITGLSMGGASTWEYAQQYPEKIAAAIPVAGWTDGSKICNISRNNVAIWAFQGELDGGETVKGLANEINSCQPSPRVIAKATVYDTVGHDSWTRTYDNTGKGIAPGNIYDWLLRQSKSNVVANISEEVYSRTTGTAKVKVYPVPCKNEIYVSYTSVLEENLGITISDISSNELLSFEKKVVKGENILPLNITSLPNGIYQMILKSTQTNQGFKIVVAD